MAALVAAPLAGAGTLAFDVNTASACGKQEIVCGNSNTNRYFSDGTVVLPAPINVTICYPEWDLLVPGRLDGRVTKYWGPTIRYGNWSADLQAVTNGPCKRFQVRPGTVFESDNCKGTRVLKVKVTRSGKYTLA